MRAYANPEPLLPRELGLFSQKSLFQKNSNKSAQTGKKGKPRPAAGDRKEMTTCSRHKGGEPAES